MRRIDIFDTTFRDSAHTLRKTPLRTDELAPLAELMDAVGFPAAEVWGGATFSTCLRQLNEDPWDRLKLLTQKLKRTPLKMLVRGQCLLGFRPVPADVIRAFAKQAAEHGIRLARVFDPLNDIDNLEIVIQSLTEAGIAVEGCLVYTQSPVHSVARFVEDARHLVRLGAKGVCLMDIAGIITPSVARDFVTEVTQTAPVSLHARSTTGMAAMAYQAAIEAGASGVDCIIAPFGISSNMPTVEAILEALSGTDVESGIDPKALRAYSKRAESIAMQHAMNQSDRQIVESAISVHKISIGMLSGLIGELKSLNAQNRLGEVLAEVTRIREDFGWPPLIAPISPMVSAQAIQNVMLGQRYAIMSRETMNYLKGLYGRPPGEINPDLLKGVPKVQGRAANLLPPRMESAEEELKKEGLLQKKEDAITYALFGQLALSYFHYRKNPSAPRKTARNLDTRVQLLTALMERRHLGRLEIGEKDFKIKLVKRGAHPRHAPAHPAGEPSSAGHAPATAPEREKATGTPVPSPLSGIFYRAPAPNQPNFVEPGAEVTEDTVIGLVEAMKLFHEVKAGGAGVLKAFACENGDSVDQGEAVAYLEPAKS